MREVGVKYGMKNSLSSGWKYVAGLLIGECVTACEAGKRKGSRDDIQGEWTDHLWCGLLGGEFMYGRMSLIFQSRNV